MVAISLSGRDTEQDSFLIGASLAQFFVVYQHCASDYQETYRLFGREEQSGVLSLEEMKERLAEREAADAVWSDSLLFTAEDVPPFPGPAARAAGRGPHHPPNLVSLLPPPPSPPVSLEAARSADLRGHPDPNFGGRHAREQRGAAHSV
jgi:hypothetical protein